MDNEQKILTKFILQLLCFTERQKNPQRSTDTNQEPRASSKYILTHQQ